MNLMEPTKGHNRNIFYYPYLNGNPIELLGFSSLPVEGYISIKIQDNLNETSWDWPSQNDHKYYFSGNYYGDYSASIPYKDVKDVCTSQDSANSTAFIKCVMMVVVTTD